MSGIGEYVSDIPTTLFLRAWCRILRRIGVRHWRDGEGWTVEVWLKGALIIAACTAFGRQWYLGKLSSQEISQLVSSTGTD